MAAPIPCGETQHIEHHKTIAPSLIPELHTQFKREKDVAHSTGTHMKTKARTGAKMDKNSVIHKHHHHHHHQQQQVEEQSPSTEAPTVESRGLPDKLDLRSFGEEMEMENRERGHGGTTYSHVEAMNRAMWAGGKRK